MTKTTPPAETAKSLDVLRRILGEEVDCVSLKGQRGHYITEEDVFRAIDKAEAQSIDNSSDRKSLAAKLRKAAFYGDYHGGSMDSISCYDRRKVEEVIAVLESSESLTGRAGNDLNKTMENARLYTGCPVSIGTPPYSHDCWKEFKHEGEHSCNPPRGGGCGKTWPNTGLKGIPTRVPRADGIG